MSLFDELRIDREPEDHKTIKAQYRVRARRQVWILILFVLLLGGSLVLGQYRPNFLEPIWARVLAIVALGGWFGLHVWNWRCPSCDMFLGKRRITSKCPGCGVVLED